MKLNKILVLASVLFIGTGCSKSGSSNDGGGGAASGSGSSLSTECYESRPLSDSNESKPPGDFNGLMLSKQESDKTFTKEELSVNGNDLFYGGTVYSDSNCQAPILSLSFEGTRSNEVALEYFNSFDVLDLKTYQTIFYQEYVDFFNAFSYCGFNDWKVGVRKDVSGKDCEGQTFPTSLYGIYGFSETGLYLGKFTEDLDGSTPEKRPVELDYSKEFK